MSSGVEGPRPINTTVTTSEPTKTEDVNLKGKSSTGASVTKEGVNTPLKEGIDQKATPDTSIEARSTQQLSNPGEEVTVEMAINHLELLGDAIKDDMGEGRIDNPAVVPDEIQWVEDTEVRQAEKASSAALKPFKALKEGAAKLKQAVFKFVHHFRTNSEVGTGVAKAAGELAGAKVDGGATVQEATEEVAQMLESPKALLSGLEQQGMHEAVEDLRGMFKVATAKNLAKMKSKLMQPEVRGQMNAVEGMSEEKAEMIINGALIASKLANPTGGKDASGIEGRGYIWGRVPAEKYDLVEWVLGMDPEMAIKVLSTHPRLANTTFAADLRRIDRQADDVVRGPRVFTEGPVTIDGVRPATREVIANSVEDIFEDGALPMFEQAEIEAENNTFLSLREQAGARFKEIGMTEVVSQPIIEEGLKHLKKNKWVPEKSAKNVEGWTASTSNNDAVRSMARKEVIEKKYGFTPDDVATMAQHRTLRNKYKSGDALPEDQAQEIAGVYKDLHKEVKSLMKGLTKEGGEDMMSHEDFEENTTLLTNGIMVNCGYAVYTDHKSADGITDTFHGVFEQDFDGMTPEQQGQAIFDLKAAMATRALELVSVLATQGPDELADLLVKHPAVYESGL